jgi:hypothetical protein
VEPDAGSCRLPASFEDACPEPDDSAFLEAIGAADELTVADPRPTPNSEIASRARRCLVGFVDLESFAAAVSWSVSGISTRPASMSSFASTDGVALLTGWDTVADRA